MLEFLSGLASRPSVLVTVAMLAALVVVLLWESARPARRFAGQQGPRAACNFGLLLINHGVAALAAPMLVLLAAEPAGIAASWPALLGAGAYALLMLDALAWLLHRTMHALALLWGVHAVHHSDDAFDASLAFRFHPIEYLYTSVATLLLVRGVGLSAEGLLFANVLTAAHNVFVHANAQLPRVLERPLRWMIITPDLHRLHHADAAAQGACNFGTVLSIWDRLTGSLRMPGDDEPARFGVRDAPQLARLSLPGLLLAPLRHPLN